MRNTAEQPIVDPSGDDFDVELPADPDDSDAGADDFSLDRFLYSPNYDSFSLNIVQAKEACFALIDQSHNSDYWWQLLDDVEQEIESNEEESWDEIMGTIFPLMHDILNQRYNGIAFGRDDEVKIAEFIHRYAVYSFLQYSSSATQRHERMENLLGTAQQIFLEGHHFVEQLRDRQAIVDYQTGYESFLSILTACRTPEEIKNATIALLEVSPKVDWEQESDQQTILGSMAKYRMEKGDYLYDDESQSRNAYTETVQIALSALIESGTSLSDSEVEFLINTIVDSTENHFLPHVAEISSKNPDSAVKCLLNILQNINNHEVQRHIALSLLYRIELGRIGISDSGIEYLTKKFDLGEYNNTDYSVQRITSDGKIGVFDKDERLKGFVQLEQDDFLGDQDVISKKLREITIDILFTPQADESPEDRQYKLQLVEEFKNNYLNTYRELFPEGNGQVPFHFNNLSLPEQGFALKFLNSHREADPVRQEFFNFIDKYGENGLKAFRSIEFDPEGGGKLLELSAQLPKEEFERLLEGYAGIYQMAETVAQWIKKVLLADLENPSAEDLLEVNIIREQILRHAQDALLYPQADDNNDDRLLSGAERLFHMRRELMKVIEMPPTIDSFETVQFILNRYFTDTRASGESISLSEQVISDGLARLYNNQEFSLRDYEGKTSDTSRSLDVLLHSLDEMIPQEMTGDPQERLIYDIGAGDGRVAIPLALSGANVVGIDYSERMVADSRERPTEFTRALRSGEPDHLVDSVIKAFTANNIEITEAAVAKLTKRIDIKHGNFFDFDAAKFRGNFGERQPDAIIIMWHTLGFAGDLPRMKQVLKNAYDILRPGGRIFIEMPDRNFGGYARAIRDFHDSHPDLPFGTIKDAPSKGGDSPTEQDEDRATWRYFPKNSEVEDVLGEVGFDINVAILESYFVKAEAGPEAKLLIKENMFVAEKPLDPARQQRMLQYTDSHSNNGGDDDQAEIEEVRRKIAA